MAKFALVMPPFSQDELRRIYTYTTYIPRFILRRTLHYLPPSPILSLRPVAGSACEDRGELICCPFYPEQRLSLAPQIIAAKITASAKTAAAMGAGIVGLGGFRYLNYTGQQLEAMTASLGVPVTSGRRIGLYAAVEGVRMAAHQQGLKWSKAEIAVVMGDDDTGRVCLQLLARENRCLTLVSLSADKLERLAERVIYETGVPLRISKQAIPVLAKAQIVLITDVAPLKNTTCECFRKGAIICDLSPAHQAARALLESRGDLMIGVGGFLAVPGWEDFSYRPWAAEGRVFAELAEPIILSLTKNNELICSGKEMTIYQLDQLAKVMRGGDFLVTGFRALGQNCRA